MYGTLSPRFPPHAAALPTVSPATEPLTGFLAPPPDTDALPVWRGLVRAPGGAPTACFRLAPPVPIEPGLPVRASVDLAAAPPENAVRPAYPEPAHAHVGSLFPQIGSGRRYNDKRDILPGVQSSADATKPHNVHNARFLAVRLGLCMPFQAAPRDSLKLLVR